MQRALGILFIILVSGCSTAPTNWGKFQSPTSEPSQSIGSYTSGCLRGGVSLLPNGKGYQMMRIGRNRFYGHSRLIKFLENLALKVQKSQLGTIFVGDMSQPRGGPASSGHRSHQNGLDVDLWYFAPKDVGRRDMPLYERATLPAPAIVTNETPNQNWDKRVFKILELAAEDEDTDRIFVHYSIKRELCKQHVNHPMHSKIRAWWKHEDHFHVRLKCPKDSPHCETQAPPSTNGCEEIDWWYSAAAKDQERQQESAPQKTTALPSECLNLAKTPEQY